MKRCIICSKRIWLLLHVFAREFQPGQWACSRRHYNTAKEAVKTGFGWVYQL